MKYQLNMHIEADVVDDRLRAAVDAAQQELQEQAAAYVDVVLRDRLIEKLTKRFGGYGMAAQFAQAAVDVLVEELRHTSILLPAIRAELEEVKDVDTPPALPAPAKPRKRLPKTEG